MRKVLFAAGAALLATQSAAQPPHAPKLLVVIAVDQFSANLWDEYRPHWTGGFAKLAQGAVFHNGYQSHANTETCPGHSTILTGDHPARTGIITNTWIDQSVPRSDKDVYCAEDERMPGSGSSSLHSLARPPAGSDSWRVAQAGEAGQPERRRRRQGPRRHHDGRPHN